MSEEPLQVKLLDTTLRDGEQTPGVSLTPENKLRIARALDELGVDIIEGGFARVSEGDFEALKLMAEAGLRAEVCSMARGVISDLDAVAECGAKSVHLVIPASDLHHQYKLKKSREQVLALTEKCVEYAKSRGIIVELSAEDASRSDIAFLKTFLAKGVEAGADRVCLCDTVGVLTPDRAYQLVSQTIEGLKVPLSIHCHDDFGMAVANSLAGVEAGAREVHATVNGLGERAGNTALEEVVMALIHLKGVKLPVRTERIYETSRLISRLTGVSIQPNKAITGDNAFTHESGIHTHGILSNPSTYEPLSPELVGVKRRLTIGKHVGTHGLKAVLDGMGINPREEQLEEIFLKVKELGDKGKTINEADLQAIAEATMGIPSIRPIKLEELIVVTGNKVTPTASVKLQVNGQMVTVAEVGVGPVDAAITAIKKVASSIADIKLEEYHVKSITGGTDAVVEVVVRLRRGDQIVTATGARGDIVMASVDAVLSAANVLMTRYLKEGRGAG